MYDAIFLDLDHCLAPPSEPGRAIYEPVFEAIRVAAGAAFDGDVLASAFATMWTTPFDAVVREYGFTDAMREAGWAAFGRVEVDVPLRGYGDLDRLAAFAPPLCLVTSGFRRLQESKIRALGIAGHFREIAIDAIDESPRLGKQGHFERLLDAHGWSPARVLVAGDSAASELAAGRRLGAVVAQTLRPGVTRADGMDHYVDDLDGLLALASSAGA